MIDATRLLADIAALAAITEPATPGYTRRAFSPAFAAGRAWLHTQFERAGLATHVDAGGNLLGVRRGSERLRAIMLGSHSDTVLGGGRYDGALGVLAALEVARALADHPLRHDLVVCDYLAEEVNDFGVACVGTRALVGELGVAELARRGADGRTLAEALRAVGGDPERLGDVRLHAGQLTAALELHIEQGPLLEHAGARLGAVSGIVGIQRARLHFVGRADHAGTTPMDLRHDALAAAATVVVHLEALARATPNFVGTAGRIEVHPNQGNVVPAQVALTLELRSLQPPLIEQCWQQLLTEAEHACTQRAVALQAELLEDAPPALPPDWLVATIHTVCARLDPRTLTLPSGAGHDTGYLAAIAPAAMIFVPSVAGRSHCAEEFTRDEDVVLGARALLEALLALDVREA